VAGPVQTTQITAFGYAVPLIVILVVIALVIGLALAVQLYLTMGLSVYRSVKQDRRDRARERIEGDMLDRLFSDDPDWEGWVAGLSGTERSSAETILDEYLRELDGSDADRLRGLGETLGVPARARRQLIRGNTYARLDALTWLTLLRRPDVAALSAFEPRTTRERSATARLYLETGHGEPKDLVVLLLEGTEQPFSVFGQDTLYRVGQRAPEALLTVAAAEYREWSRPLLIQVLQVCKYLDTSIREGDLGWMTASLEDGDEAVRVGAARALGNFGWNEDIRDRLFLERIVADPSYRARGAAYEMLAGWGDDRALSILLFALVSETDDRALLRGLEALVPRRDRVDDATLAIFGDAWDWSREHARYDDTARRRVEAR